MAYDFVILTDDQFINPPTSELEEAGWKEDHYLLKALEELGHRVIRKSWADPEFDWSSCSYAIFRTTWDYFGRFAEWQTWLKKAHAQTSFINPYPLVAWNMDKHYLGELQQKGIRIPETRYIEKGEQVSLKALHEQMGWQDTILKPCIAGSARHTYRLNPENLIDYETIFSQLIAEEAMMLQPFQHHILTQGEVSIMVIGGKFTHAVIKQAKDGDFRVQSDYGGSYSLHKPTREEIDFAEKAIAVLEQLPAYARVDIIRDNENRLALIEIELIEPELWFRLYPAAATALAEHLSKTCGVNH